MTEGFPERQPDWGVDPRYKPPAKDSGLILRFMGNTARVIGLNFVGQIDPYQLLGAGQRLIQLGLRMLEISDAKETQSALQVASRLPDQAAPGGISRVGY